MNPVTAQILNQAEKHRRCEQVEAFRLRKQSREARSSRANPLELLREVFRIMVKSAA
jgi:hypothetical protein